MKRFRLIVRLLMGAIFLVFGLNYFLSFFSTPDVSAPGKDFMLSLIQTGYLMPVEKFMEILGGALLIANVWAPFAVVLLTPLVANIFLFHFFLAPGGIAGALLLLAAQIFLIYAYRDHYRPMFMKETQVQLRRPSRLRKISSKEHTTTVLEKLRPAYPDH